MQYMLLHAMISYDVFFITLYWGRYHCFNYACAHGILPDKYENLELYKRYYVLCWSSLKLLHTS